MIHDKTGKIIEKGQLIDIEVPPICTALVVDVKHSPLEIPGQGLLPACITIQIVSAMPADGQGVIRGYVVKDAPTEEEKARQAERESQGNVSRFKVQ